VPDSPPSVVVLAGPNGAGKSTAAPFLLGEELGIAHFVNADVIAQGLSAFDPESAAMTAGRIMLARLRELAEARETFAFETTLASRSFAPWIAALIGQGYTFELIYLWLPAPELAIRRVGSRVAAGGHHVPEDVISRRYSRSLKNFFSLYRPLATTWRCYDNSAGGPPRIVAAGQYSETTDIADTATWDAVRKAAEHD
jgi:predicted ABC-type ATPase